MVLESCGLFCSPHCFHALGWVKDIQLAAIPYVLPWGLGFTLEKVGQIYQKPKW